MFNNFGMDFGNFPTMKKSSDSFGFSTNSNIAMNMPSDFSQMNNKGSMMFSQNSQLDQPSQSFQSFQSSSNSVTNQQPLQGSQSFQTFQTSQPITTITVNQPLEKLPSIT